MLGLLNTRREHAQTHREKETERDGSYYNDINHGKVTVGSKTGTERDEWIERDEDVDRQIRQTEINR